MCCIYEGKRMIEVKNVSMSFRLSQDRIQSIKEYLVTLAKGKLKYKEFWALKNVRTAYKSGRARCRINSSAARLFHDVKQFTLLTVTTPVFVVMYYSHPFRLAKTSLAKQSTSHCVVFDTQADFVGAIEHIAPLGSCEFAEDYRKIGTFLRADRVVRPYEFSVSLPASTPTCCSERFLQALLPPAPCGRGRRPRGYRNSRP